MSTTAHDRGSAERRRHARRNIIGRELVTAELNSGGALVLDVSEGGVAVQPFAPVAPGETSQVRFRLPETDGSFNGTGMVAWVGRGGRAGIRFINVPEEARTHLRQWLNAEPDTEADAIERAPAEQEQLDLDGLLRMTAERALTISAATGVAIALGDAAGMTCRVCLGNAPDVGAWLSPESGLTGYCLRSGATIHCADTQSDPRVDATAAQRLCVRSMAVVPVFSGEMLVGVIDVLSDCAMAFAPRHVERLERLAALLGSTLEHVQKRAGAGQAATPKMVGQHSGTRPVPTRKEPDGVTDPVIAREVKASVGGEWPVEVSPLAALPEIIRATDAVVDDQAVRKPEAATTGAPAKSSLVGEAKTAGKPAEDKKPAVEKKAAAENKAASKGNSNGSKVVTPVAFFETYPAENQAQRVINVLQKYWTSRNR